MFRLIILILFFIANINIIYIMKTNMYILMLVSFFLALFSLFQYKKIYCSYQNTINFDFKIYREKIILTIVLALFLSNLACFFQCFKQEEYGSKKIETIFVKKSNPFLLFKTDSKLLVHLQDKKSIYDLKENNTYIITADIKPLNYNKKGYAYSITDIKKIEDAKSYSLYSKIKIHLDKLKNQVKERILYRYGDNNGSLINSLVLGVKSDDLNDKTDTLKNLGLIHILSISGFHVALLDICLKKMKLNKISSIIIVIYCIFVSSIPAYRSMLTMIISKGNKKMRLPDDPLNNLLISAIILLCLYPYLIYDLSFQLTYLSTFGLFFFSRELEKYFINKISLKFIKPWMLSSLAVSIATFITTFPIVVKLSSSYNLCFILSNIFILPIYTVITVLSFLAVVISNFTYLSMINSFILEVFIKISDLVEFIFIEYFSILLPTNQLIYVYLFFLGILIFIGYLAKFKKIENYIFSYYELIIHSKKLSFIKLVSIICIVFVMINNTYYFKPKVIYKVKNGRYILDILYQRSSVTILDEMDVKKDDKKYYKEVYMVLENIKKDTKNKYMFEYKNNNFEMKNSYKSLKFKLGREKDYGKIYDEDFNMLMDDIILKEYTLENNKIN